ncbi:hypothetical protein AN416_29640 (plasmid) [Paraburkholderia caribensis]|nr:hypothetical protein AN416_29640 [Paraburkholderia caribensis]CAG9233386.1 conserved hypothetical protein [Paraburkholderia caribensis]
MIGKDDKLLDELKAAIAEVSKLGECDGIEIAQRNYVRTVLEEYLSYLEGSAAQSSTVDANRVGRIVVEYWPMNLPVCEHVVQVEQKLRAFLGRK